MNKDESSSAIVTTSCRHDSPWKKDEMYAIRIFKVQQKSPGGDDLQREAVVFQWKTKEDYETDAESHWRPYRGMEKELALPVGGDVSQETVYRETFEALHTQYGGPLPRAK